MKISTQELFELLREKRNKLAQQNNVEPFMILHNSMLMEIAERKPTSFEELGKIKGFGKKRIDKYGQFILKIVNGKTKNKSTKYMKDRIFKVGEFIDFLNSVLVPQKSIIQGEIGEVKPRNGYTFFKLLDKNEEAVLNCFVWQRVLDNLGVNLKEGSEIQVAGFPKVFKRRGSFNFEIQNLGLVGEGELKLAFEALKRKLSQTGFFVPERKKPIPLYPQNIGLITSDFGDAKNDFLTHLGKFGFRIHFYDVRVEGLYAVDDIISALRWFNENMLDIEVLVLTRGGGSLESLQPFNSEAVAKAIFSSKIPIITGIGHENNETIADLTADFYGSTPTHSARVICDNWRKALDSTSSYKNNFISIFNRQCKVLKEKLLNWNNSISSSYLKTLNAKKERLDDLQKNLTSNFKNILNKIKIVKNAFFNNFNRLQQSHSEKNFTLDNIKNIFDQEAQRWLKFQYGLVTDNETWLKLSDPTRRLKQGYSIIFDQNKKTVRNARQLKVNQKLNLKFYNGSADSRVERIY